MSNIMYNIILQVCILLSLFLSLQGHFMFIFKKSSRFSQQALLRSPTFQQASSDCVMTFW